MITLNTYKESLITELFDKPVKYQLLRTSKIGKSDYINEYEFVIDSLNYLVNIDTETKITTSGKIAKTADVSFIIKSFSKYTDNAVGKTGTGNEFVVFSTVMQIIKDLLKSDSTINRITFTSEKDNNDTKDGNRTTLYKKMINRYLPSGWKVNIIPDNDRTKFYLFEPLS